ncbi:MAG: hypothetical protein M3R23_06405 [Actinomycetota bacterium]|nr:hypothetical protein [Actinomycetota bacterium]
MPAIIDSAPNCIQHLQTATPPDDAADFIVGARFEHCAGFMTFGPGSTYGDGGTSATTAYYALTWIGIAVTVIVLVAWVLYENRRLIAYAATRGRGGSPNAASAAAEETELT